MNRRELLKAGAWAAPALVLATASPAAATTSVPTEPPSLICAANDPAVLDASFQGNILVIRTRSGQSNAIDVTIRQPGHPQYHRNYVTQGKNPGDNQILYVPGESIYVPLERHYDPARGDWMQVRTIHNENCVEVAP